MVTLQSLANCPKTHTKTSAYLGQSLKIDTNPSAIPSQSLANPSPIPQLNASKSTPTPPEIRANPSPAPDSRSSKWTEDKRAKSYNMEAPSCNLKAHKFNISLLCCRGQKQCQSFLTLVPRVRAGAMSKATWLFLSIVNAHSIYKVNMLSAPPDICDYFCKRVGKLRHKASTSWWSLMPSTTCFSLAA